MRKNECVLGGLNLTAFSCYVAESNFLDAPARDIDTIQVAGRNGDLHIDNGRYNNFEMRVKLCITEDMQNNMERLRNHVNSFKGAYMRYSESLTPNEYRMVSFKNAFVSGDTDAHGGAVTLTFDAMPQRFILGGDVPVIFTLSGAIHNYTAETARPLIRVYGYGTIELGDTIITVMNSGDYIDIDCELMECYHGSEWRNDHVGFSSNDFPTLPSGTTTVTLNGEITRVEITPHWWHI